MAFPAGCYPRSQKPLSAPFVGVLGNFRVTGRDSNSLDVAWDVSGMPTFRIEWQDAGGDWSSLYSYDTTEGGSLHLPILVPDSPYDVRVRAEVGALVSEWAVLSNLYTGGITPSSVPGNPDVYGAVNVHWDNSVYLQMSSINIYANGVLVASGVTPIYGSYVVDGLTPLVTYTFELSSIGVNGGQEGTRSAGVDLYAGTGSAPVNTILPSVSGSDSFLSTDDGSWTADPGCSFTYQWQSYGTDIPGETNNSFYPGYTPGEYSCRVTATNAVGSAYADSNTYTIV